MIIGPTFTGTQMLAQSQQENLFIQFIYSKPARETQKYLEITNSKSA